MGVLTERKRERERAREKEKNKTCSRYSPWRDFLDAYSNSIEGCCKNLFVVDTQYDCGSLSTYIEFGTRYRLPSDAHGVFRTQGILILDRCRWVADRRDPFHDPNLGTLNMVLAKLMHATC